MLDMTVGQLIGSAFVLAVALVVLAWDMRHGR
jgi:hypothetical protein